MLLFGWAVFLMLSLHVGGCILWAYSLLYLGLIPHAYDAIYFCANAYTTLGFGSVDLGPHWRNISPVIGISGLFTFAWTTSALVSVVAAHRELIDQLEDERERQIEMRFELQKDQWNALKSELHAEQSEKEKTRAQAAGASFLQRREIWRDERARVKKLREAKTAEVAELRRKEREEEAKLIPVVPPEKPGDSK
jgi:Ion channel